MWNFKAEQQDESGTLTLDGELTIQRANELRTTLINSLDSVSHVRLDLENVAAIDLTCIQLICSAHLTVTKSNKRLTVQSCPEDFRQTVQDAGFSNVKKIAF